MSRNGRKMDEYDKKFAEMQKYVPFIEAMIERLRRSTDATREKRLAKMKQLLGILTSSKRKYVYIYDLLMQNDI